ncbi:MAG: MBL fold metallo-hydrolase, partial [Deltaproteobacteria bacterium]
MFNADDVKADGSDFDVLFNDGETFTVGGLTVEVMHTPGHTPADICYKIGDTVFVGDTLFMPDYGTARTDFPGGDARTLYASIQRLLALPRATKLYMCHDYLPEGRDDYRWETTVGEQLDANIHLKDAGEDSFVHLREARDAKLAAPRLLLPAIQVNIRAGNFPAAEDNGVQYLRIPVRIKKKKLIV